MTEKPQTCAERETGYMKGYLFLSSLHMLAKRMRDTAHAVQRVHQQTPF